MYRLYSIKLNMKTVNAVLVILAFPFVMGKWEEGRVNAPVGVRGAEEVPSIETCPRDSPCLCETEAHLVSIKCSGPAVTEETLTRMFRLLREANGLSPGASYYISKFTLDQSSVSELDWTPFLNTTIFNLEISYNNFSRFTGPPVEEIEGRGQIHAVIVNFENNIFPTLGHSLAYFAPDLLTRLELKFEESFAFQINASAPEFLPGLSAFQNLWELWLSSSGLEQLGSRQFWGLKQLRKLNLDGNRLSSGSIPSDAFEFEFPPEMLDVTLYIKLSGNPKLTEDTFPVNSSLLRIQRPIHLSLSRTGLRTLPQEIFEPFLEAHSQNELELIGTRMMCDERLRWLKERAGEFKSKVRYSTCSDGHTSIFESDLTDKPDDGNGSNRFTLNISTITAFITITILTTSNSYFLFP